ncbi:4-hydroxy-tetrahydrodipicolinate synthase [Bdellovibrionota bacterium FG-2]
MRGVWTALVTPFSTTNELDLKAYRKIIEDQIEAGVAGIIPCGTTGESPTLSQEEKKTLIQTALELATGTPVKVVAGTGSNNTQTTVEFSKWASDQGVAGVLVVTPYYNKPSQAGLEAHFRAVAEAVKCEVILYNVPGRAGVSLTATTIAKLCDHPRITTVKEASANLTFISEVFDMLSLVRRKADILSGDDASFLPILSVGGVGVISVSSNLFPRAMVALQTAFEKGKLDEARAIHQKYYPLFRDLFVESNPVPIKYAMAEAGFCLEHVRAPLSSMADESRGKLSQSLKRCGVSRGVRL